MSCICVSKCMCTCVERTKTDIRCLLCHSPSDIMKQGHSLSPELGISGFLAGQLTLGIPSVCFLKTGIIGALPCHLVLLEIHAIEAINLCSCYHK